MGLAQGSHRLTRAFNDLDVGASDDEDQNSELDKAAGQDGDTQRVIDRNEAGTSIVAVLPRA